MEKNLVIAVLVVMVLVVALFSSGVFTGQAVHDLWGSQRCSEANPCPAGEGDCDHNSECLTGYCSMDVGSNYPEAADVRGPKKVQLLDVCECPTGQIWDVESQKCFVDSFEGSKTFMLKVGDMVAIPVGVDVYEVTVEQALKTKADASANVNVNYGGGSAKLNLVQDVGRSVGSVKLTVTEVREEKTFARTKLYVTFLVEELV